jgi:hypothetical protein
VTWCEKKIVPPAAKNFGNKNEKQLLMGPAHARPTHFESSVEEAFRFVCRHLHKPVSFDMSIFGSHQVAAECFIACIDWREWSHIFVDGSSYLKRISLLAKIQESHEYYLDCNGSNSIDCAVSSESILIIGANDRSFVIGARTPAFDRHPDSMMVLSPPWDTTGNNLILFMMQKQADELVTLYSQTHLLVLTPTIHDATTPIILVPWKPPPETIPRMNRELAVQMVSATCGLPNVLAQLIFKLTMHSPTIHATRNLLTKIIVSPSASRGEELL